MASLLAPALKAPAIVSDVEVEILCYCAQPRLNKDETEKLEALLQCAVDWRSLLQMASWHGMMSTLYKKVDAYSVDVPTPIVSELKTVFNLNSLRNRALTQELLRLMVLFESNNIAAIPFKGPVSAVEIYGSLSLRQFSDLDILVRPHDFAKAKSLLLEDRYRRSQPIQGIANVEAEELALMQSRGEYSLCHKNGHFLIDLHERLIAGEFPLLSADFGIFWQRLSPITLLGTEVLSFCIEDLLLYLCIHGSKDLWRKLSWVCDIAMLIHNHPTINWALIIERSQKLESEQMLWLGISLAKDLLKIPLPEVASKRLETHFRKQALANQIQAQLTSGILPSAIVYSKLQRVLFHGQIVENKSDRLRYYLRVASNMLLHPLRPNINDKAFVSLPENLHLLYYLIRPFRLTAEASNKLIQQFSKINAS